MARKTALPPVDSVSSAAARATALDQMSANVQDVELGRTASKGRARKGISVTFKVERWTGTPVQCAHPCAMHDRS
jgi:hypothetical protein